MLKKIILLLSLFLSINVALTSSIKPLKQSVYPKQSLEERASIGNRIYELLKKRSAIRNQLLQVYEKLPDKNIEPPAKETFTLGYVIGSAILTGIVATPAFTINYLNKYITPEGYQNAVDKISLGIAGLIGARGSFKIAKQGTKSIYDFFRYESIRKEIKELENKLSETTGSINGIRRKHSGLYDILHIDDYERLYNAFIEFYENNNTIITKDKINTFISAHPDIFFTAHASYDSNISYILKAFRNVKNKLIIYAIDTENNSSWSSGDLTTDILYGMAGLMALPWILLFSAVDRSGKEKTVEINSSYEEYKRLNQWEYEKYKQIDRVATIIKKLTALESEEE